MIVDHLDRGWVGGDAGWQLWPPRERFVWPGAGMVWSASMRDRGMQIQVLGPLEVRQADGLVALGGVKQRAVLAMLALRVNEVVPSEWLIEGLWGAQAPPSATYGVQVYVSRRRKALRGAAPAAGGPAAAPPPG